MNENEYLKILRSELKGLAPEETNEILRDQAEHFAAARASGKSDEDICRSLGSPRQLAQEYIASSLIERSQGTGSNAQLSRAVLGVLKAFFILAPFNFLILIGPFLFTVALLLSAWTFFLGAGASGVISAFAIPFMQGLQVVPTGLRVSAFFGLLAVAGLGFSGVFVMVKTTELYLRAVLSYARWNIQFVKGARV